MDASEPRNLAPELAPRLKGARGRLQRAYGRLRCMSPAEIAWRVLRAFQARAERSRLNDALVVPAPDLAASPNRWFHADKSIDAKPYVAAADRVAEGWLDVYALKGVDLGSPPRWNRDPKSGIEAPAVFGKLLEVGNPDLVGDIKYVWQPNRHAHLVTLAQAWALTRRRRYLEALQESLESWFLACPYALGPNWSSALEAASRLANWAAAWQLTGFEVLEKNFSERWLRSVYQHCEFIRGWFTLHASAGHRLVGEAAGLFVGALAWPHWRESRGWAATAKAILEREAVAQTSPHGVHREQSTALHAFVLERLMLCLVAGKANGQWFSPDYESRIEAMLDFLASVMDARGNVPMFGDGEAQDAASDPALCRALLASGAVLFKRGDFKLKARKLDERARWLLGPQAAREFAELDSEKTRLPLRQAFPEGGYFIIGCGFDSAREIRLVADAGPLGFRAAAAHGHADALSFTLSAGGRELLVDPGSYAWHTQAAWRRYFRGTAAHNTVRIDGLDQSEPGGRFRWLKPARAGCSLWLSSPEKDSFEGWHDGYMRLEDPVKHRRLIELEKRSRRIVVEDALEMGEEHDVELLFHFSERCVVDPVEEGFVVVQDHVSVLLRLPPGGTSRVYQGNLSPMLGWRSPAFDVRVASPTVVWHARLAGPARLRTELCVSFS